MEINAYRQVVELAYGKTGKFRHYCTRKVFLKVIQFAFRFTEHFSKAAFQYWSTHFALFFN
jgi:hypothetical protein